MEIGKEIDTRTITPVRREIPTERPATRPARRQIPATKPVKDPATPNKTPVKR